MGSHLHVPLLLSTSSCGQFVNADMPHRGVLLCLFPKDTVLHSVQGPKHDFWLQELKSNAEVWELLMKSKR